MGIFVIILAGGWILGMMAEGLMGGIQSAADMSVYSWLSMFSGLAFAIASPVMAVVTLRYGRRHEAAIREHAKLSSLLTMYRILFWLAAIGALLLAAFVIWLGTHIGPVR